MTTCEYETEIDVDPFPERCGKPATAQASDGATGEVHYVCDEHAAAVEGIYTIARLHPVVAERLRLGHVAECTEGDEDGPSRCAPSCHLARS
jgi:hypothetical protein